MTPQTLAELRRTEPQTLAEAVEMLQQWPVVNEVINAGIMNLSEKGHPITLFVQGAVLAAMAMQAQNAQPEVEWLEGLMKL